MGYIFENALDQWREGERRVGGAGLDEAVRAVFEELRKRLGSAFYVQELVDLYGGDADWASEIAWGRSAGSDAQSVVDAAFALYAREAIDYAGGRRHRVDERVE